MSDGSWQAFDPMRPPEGKVDIWVSDGKRGWPATFVKRVSSRWMDERGHWAFIPEGAVVTHWRRYVGPNGEVMPWR